MPLILASIKIEFRKTINKQTYYILFIIIIDICCYRILVMFINSVSFSVRTDFSYCCIISCVMFNSMCGAII